MKVTYCKENFFILKRSRKWIFDRYDHRKKFFSHVGSYRQKKNLDICNSPCRKSKQLLIQNDRHKNI